MFITHSARSWVGDLPSVCHPLVVGPLLVGKRPVEDHTDVSHGVDAHRRAFEHRSGGRQEGKKRVSTQRRQLEDTDKLPGIITTAALCGWYNLLPSHVLSRPLTLKHYDAQTHSQTDSTRVKLSDTLTYKHPRSAENRRSSGSRCCVVGVLCL